MHFAKYDIPRHLNEKHKRKGIRYSKRKAKFTAFETSVALLALLDKDLPQQVSEKLSNCEDWLTSQIGKKSDKKDKLGRAAIQAEAKKMLIDSLLLIRTKHLDVHK
jgi:hypothetical protein